jgi:hypothetical protein
VNFSEIYMYIFSAMKIVRFDTRGSGFNLKISFGQLSNYILVNPQVHYSVHKTSSVNSTL